MLSSIVVFLVDNSDALRFVRQLRRSCGESASTLWGQARCDNPNDISYMGALAVGLEGRPVLPVLGRSLIAEPNGVRDSAIFLA